MKRIITFLFLYSKILYSDSAMIDLPSSPQYLKDLEKRKEKERILSEIYYNLPLKKNDQEIYFLDRYKFYQEYFKSELDFLNSYKISNLQNLSPELFLNKDKKNEIYIQNVSEFNEIFSKRYPEESILILENKMIEVFNRETDLNIIFSEIREIHKKQKINNSDYLNFLIGMTDVITSSSWLKEYGDQYKVDDSIRENILKETYINSNGNNNVYQYFEFPRIIELMLTLDSELDVVCRVMNYFEDRVKNISEDVDNYDSNIAKLSRWVLEITEIFKNRNLTNEILKNKCSSNLGIFDDFIEAERMGYINIAKNNYEVGENLLSNSNITSLESLCHNSIEALYIYFRNIEISKNETSIRDDLISTEASCLIRSRIDPNSENMNTRISYIQIGKSDIMLMSPNGTPLEKFNNSLLKILKQTNPNYRN